MTVGAAEYDCLSYDKEIAPFALFLLPTGIDPPLAPRP